MVPAPYSSQECSRCHYVDSGSRKGSLFKCVWCGLRVHADVNASRVIRSRRSWPSYMLTWGRKRILLFLQERFKNFYGFETYPVKDSSDRTIPGYMRWCVDGVVHAHTGALECSVCVKRIGRVEAQTLHRIAGTQSAQGALRRIEGRIDGVLVRSK